MVSKFQNSDFGNSGLEVLKCLSEKLKILHIIFNLFIYLLFIFFTAIYSIQGSRNSQDRGGHKQVGDMNVIIGKSSFAIPVRHWNIGNIIFVFC